MKSSATMISQFEFRLLIASFASMSKMLAVQPSLNDSIGKKKNFVQFYLLLIPLLHT